MKFRRLLCAFLLPLIVLTLGPAVPVVSAQQPVEKRAPAAASTAAASPESLGLSSQRLERLHAAMQQEIDQKKSMSGAVTLLARHGKLVELKAYGKKDLATGAPMTTDTIFRIFSMTKVVTGVSMMILYEEGQVESRRTPSQNTSRIRAPESLQGPRHKRQNDRRGSPASPDHGRADDPYRRLHLRRLRRRSGRQGLPIGGCDAARNISRR